MGGNAAEAHPCGFKWVIEAKHRPTRPSLVVVDPRFTRSAAMSRLLRADSRRVSDIAFLGGVINYLLSGNDKIQTEYVRNVHQRAVHRRARLQVRGRPVQRLQRRQAQLRPQVVELRARRARAWRKVDMTMQDPQCVLQIMKRHYARYTPELVSAHHGHAAGQVPEGLRVHRQRPAPADAHHDHHVCAGLDAAQPPARR